MPFGTRVMLVLDPRPRNAFTPRAKPATVFSPCSSVTGGFWTVQEGKLRCRTNLVFQGMEQNDLAWVKINIDNWDAPDAPMPLPPVEHYDAGAIVQVEEVGGSPARRETATCPACIASRLKRKQTGEHTLVWGECLRAIPLSSCDTSATYSFAKYS